MMVAGRLRLWAVWVVVMAAGPVAAQESGSEAAAAPVSVPASAAVSVPAAAPASGSAPESVPAPESASASASARASVLVAPVQGNAALRAEDGGRVEGALRRGLEARGFQVVGSQELLGQAVIACQTPECIKQALEAAGAAFAIVPAIWSRESGGEELTLTLVQGSGRRNLNARGIVGDDLTEVTEDLLDQLLVRRATAGSETAAGTVTRTAAASPRRVDASRRPRGSGAGSARPHAWKAGPIILIAGGAASFVAIGVGAAVKNDDQQLNTAGVAAWAAVGAAAIGGGIAWWVVGEKRRQRKPESAAALAPELAFYPTKIDLRLRF